MLDSLSSTFGGVLSDDNFLLVEVVPCFVKLLGSPHDDIREQAVCALGVVAGDSPKGRDLVLSHGALTLLLNEVTVNAKISMLRNAAWTLSNLCKGKWHEPQPPFKKVRPALKKLQQLVNYEDEEVLTYSCQALSYLSYGTDDQIDAVIEAGVCPRLVKLLHHCSPSVLIPALETVSNIVSGEDTQIQVILDHEPLGCLLSLLIDNPNESIKKEACFIISKIAAGNKKQIQAVIEAQCIGPLVNLLQSAEFDLTKYAAWAIFNASSGGSREQIKYLVDKGCIKPLCDLLLSPDPGTVTVCLKCLANILMAGEVKKNIGSPADGNCYASLIGDAKGLEKIENLLSHDNTKIAKEAVYIRHILKGDRKDFIPKEICEDLDLHLEFCEDTSSLSEDDDDSDSCSHSTPYFCPRRSYVSGTSIMGLVGRNLLIIAADSRSVYEDSGDVADDTTVKLHWITKHVYAADAGDVHTNADVFTAARDHYRALGDHAFPLKRIARFVADLRGLTPGHSTFIVGGRVNSPGKPRMYIVRAEEQLGVHRGSMYYVHKATKARESAVAGTGQQYLQAVLTAHEGFQVEATATGFGGALNLIKEAMLAAKTNSSASGGPIRMVVITNSEVSFAEAQPLDPVDRESEYGEWTGGTFVPHGSI